MQAQFDSRVRKIHWRRDRLPTPAFLGFPCGSVGKESTCNVGDLGSIPRLGRSLGEEKGYPLQYSGLENSVDWESMGQKESDRTEQLSLSLCCCPRIHKGALDQASATGPGWIKGALALEEYFSNWRVTIYYYPMNFIWWMIIPLKKNWKAYNVMECIVYSKDK